MKKVHIYRHKVGVEFSILSPTDEALRKHIQGAKRCFINKTRIPEYYYIMQENAYIDVIEFSNEDDYINFILGYSELIYKIED